MDELDKAVAISESKLNYASELTGGPVARSRRKKSGSTLINGLIIGAIILLSVIVTVLILAFVSLLLPAIKEKSYIVLNVKINIMIPIILALVILVICIAIILLSYVLIKRTKKR